ncbi:TetR family transcriptional regulator [Altererythrobacter arenosus]|uniref:TetR family transcriptional regulator n=1 Tax=Altererythrobacter arenosus TaxID=3032592 RepID=A0ABY8FTR7_9SPHN|nr:TetR/AcrR family transcriptional regulator [Altererythrobacter sp. CAU 1644]WFL78403.1 TetR family transcriptional regulator [Altererythrobacter sp. CAU 1644]
MKTRDRIIATARNLFNELGYSAVTTAALAKACGIAEGNLWYHFKTKRDLLAAITEEIGEHIERRMAMPLDPDEPAQSYATWLEALMDEQREYRFLYRDSPHHDEHVEVMAANVPGWLQRSQDSIEQYLRAMVDCNLLDWPTDRLGDLAANATIVLRYGLEHFSERGEPEGAVRKTLLQHLTLFEHRLDSGAAETLRKAVERIERRVKKAA